MSRASFGKPLKGVGSLSQKFIGPIEDGIFSSISSGGLEMTNISISGGTIDGVVIGSNQPGPGYFTTLQTGDPSGQGYEVCFYGQTVGDEACWEPVIGQWNIQGDLLVRDISNFGNLKISGNTLSSTNTNGNIIVDPIGSGTIILSGPILQTTSSGNISFNTDSGLFNLNTSTTISSTSGTNNTLATQNGNIILTTGTDILATTITNISTGSDPVITTTPQHHLTVGDTITITGSNSSPDVDGVFTVLTVPSSTTFTISSPVTVSGNTGNIVKDNDIYLNATNNINIPSDVKLTLGNDNINIVSDGTDLTITADTGNVNIDSNTIINGDLIVNGVTTSVESTVVTIEDPVITLGSSASVLDVKDRGIEYKWNDSGTERIGFFGVDRTDNCFKYIPIATNTNETFSGDLGCADFKTISADTINLNNGVINNVETLNSCNITCDETLTITGGDKIIMNSPDTVVNSNFQVNGSLTEIKSSNLVISDPIITLGQNTTQDNKDRGVEYKWVDGVTLKTGFFGIDRTDNCFKYIPDATNTGEVISGALGCADFGSLTVSDLTVTGNTTFTGQTISTEYITSGNPNPSKNVTFITTTTGVVTGILQAAPAEGFTKHIVAISLTGGSEYHLTAPSGILLDPGSGTTAAKTIKFEHSGQSIMLIWSNTVNCYIIANSGVCMS